MPTARTPARRPPPRASRRVTSTEAKNRFGQVFDDALEGVVVVITRHATPKAVLLSYDAYQALTRPPTNTLNDLRASFDEMLARMQSPRSRAGVRAAFRATPKQLGKAAVAAASRRG
jgi:prevent-host-death family protein